MGDFRSSERVAGIIEFAVATLMGIVAVLIAYASWQSSLYGGEQATKYTKGTAIIGEGNSMYNEAAQYIAQDMDIWNRISDLRIDIAFAEDKGDTAEVERFQWKLDQVMADNVTDELAEAIDWADAQDEYASPFDMDGYLDSYYTDASDKYQEGQDMIESGQKDNELGDILGLVTVIFSVALFLLGIVIMLKNNFVKVGLLAVSAGALVYGLIMMVGVPMLTL